MTRKPQIKNNRVLKINPTSAETVVSAFPALVKLINKTIEESLIPNGIRIGLVKKNDNIIVPNKDTIIEINDEVVLLSLSESLHKVEELFQVRGAF